MLPNCLKSDDILISENSSKGVRDFRAFLKYLETKKLIHEPILNMDKGFDSPFEESVYQLLDDSGVKTVPQVGVAGYFIDLAVISKNSNDFLLGIECDGAKYHSSKSARDRDRLKQDVLENLGWVIYRIWSVDWYKNREHEIKKLLFEIGKLQKNHDDKFNKIDSETKKFFIEDQKLKQVQEKLFVSDLTTKDKLIKLRDRTISKGHKIDKTSILSPLMLDQFLQKKPRDMDDFREKISLELRENINREEIRFLGDIFEILEMADE